MKRSHKIVATVLSIELLLYGVYLIYGSKGIKAINAVRRENQEIETQIAMLHQNNAQLEARISDWKKYDWYKERQAREELQFAHADEEVFLT